LLTDQQTSVVKQILDDLAPCLNGYLRSISEAEAGRRKPTPEPANNGDTTPAP
jgi:hypothetical protein